MKRVFMKRVLTVMLSFWAASLLSAQGTLRSHVTTVAYLDSLRSDSLLQVRYTNAVRARNIRGPTAPG